MNKEDKAITYVVKTIDGKIFTSVPSPFYGVSRPSVEDYLWKGKPFTVKMEDGSITINARYILYVQELYQS